MHSDPVTQTECLHSLAGTLGHTPDNKQPGPCLQTRTGAASRGHGRQCLPALPCKAEALHGAQGAWLVSKAPDGHDVAPEGANHEVGPLLSHAQAAGQLGPGPMLQVEHLHSVDKMVK